MKTTTNMITYVKGLVGAGSVALALSAVAIENPAAEEAPKQKENKGAAAEDAPMEGQKQIKRMAMLGLGGSPVSETLSLHLGLEAGAGLTIFHVVPGSGAAKAGLERHDVLTEVEGRKIGSQQDLRDAVGAQKPGDEVNIKFIHKGKAEEKKVVLGERVDMPQIMPGGGANPWQNGMGGNIPEADMKRMRGEMQKQLDQIRKQLQGQNEGAGVQLDLQRLLQGAIQDAPKGAPKGKAKGGFHFSASTSITMMDRDGSVTMKTIEGKKEVIVKDKAGKVVFEGPYQTEQDKAAVPDDIRDRLERLNFGNNGNGGLRLKILPGGMVPPPAEPDEDEASE